MTIKFESKLIIFLSYFDEIYGPQILDLYPYEHSNQFQNVVDILSILIDIAALNDEQTWRFLYADQNFASQNLRLSLINPEARGGLSDVMISIILKPSHGEFTGALAQDWNNIYVLQDLVSENISFDNNIPGFREETNFSQQLQSAHKKIIDQFQFFVDAISPNTHHIT